MMHSHRSSRRAFLRQAGTWAAGVGLGTGTVSLGAPAMLLAQDESAALRKRMIVHSFDPEDFEMRVENIDSWLTPNDLLFVRSHVHTPEVDVKDWTLQVDGEVERTEGDPQVRKQSGNQRLGLVGLEGERHDRI